MREQSASWTRLCTHSGMASASRRDPLLVSMLEHGEDKFGFVHGSVAFDWDDSQGWFCRAHGAVNKGERIVGISTSWLLSVPLARRLFSEIVLSSLPRSAPKRSRTAALSLREPALLSLALAAAKLESPDTPETWRCYARSLPVLVKSGCNPLCFGLREGDESTRAVLASVTHLIDPTEEGLGKKFRECLGPTEVWNQSVSAREAALQLIAQTCLSLCEDEESLTVQERLELGARRVLSGMHVSVEDGSALSTLSGAWLWSQSMYWSRAMSPFPAREGGCMVPLCDLLNHEQRSPHRFQLDEEGRILWVVAGSAVGPGEEVVINYGAKTETELWLWHGFVTHSPRRCLVAVSLEATDGGFTLRHLQSPSNKAIDRLVESPGRETAMERPSVVYLDGSQGGVDELHRSAHRETSESSWLDALRSGATPDPAVSDACSREADRLARSLPLDVASSHPLQFLASTILAHVRQCVH
jgi:hypothetical protein